MCTVLSIGHETLLIGVNYHCAVFSHFARLSGVYTIWFQHPEIEVQILRQNTLKSMLCEIPVFQFHCRYVGRSSEETCPVSHSGRTEYINGRPTDNIRLFVSTPSITRVIPLLLISLRCHVYLQAYDSPYGIH